MFQPHNHSLKVAKVHFATEVSLKNVHVYVHVVFNSWLLQSVIYLKTDRYILIYFVYN